MRKLILLLKLFNGTRKERPPKRKTLDIVQMANRTVVEEQRVLRTKGVGA